MVEESSDLSTASCVRASTAPAGAGAGGDAGLLALSLSPEIAGRCLDAADATQRPQPSYLAANRTGWPHGGVYRIAA